MKMIDLDIETLKNGEIHFESDADKIDFLKKIVFILGAAVASESKVDAKEMGELILSSQTATDFAKESLSNESLQEVPLTKLIKASINL